MDEEKFWRVIDAPKLESQGNTDAQLEILRENLEKLSADEIASFDEIFTEFYLQSYDWKLWAAAYLINGGCSDDGFDYFRAGLILQGKKIFNEVLSDPESLVHVINFEDGDLDEESEWAIGVEEILYLPFKIYEEKTGKEIPADRSFPKEPSGQSWNEDNVDQLLPNLARYCNEGMD